MTRELGYVSLIELRTVRGKLGLPVERDQHFDADKALSAYADEARTRTRRHMTISGAWRPRRPISTLTGQGILDNLLDLLHTLKHRRIIVQWTRIEIFCRGSLAGYRWRPLPSRS
jgi:hypothetical protein